MTTYIVTNNADAGAGSLRDAISRADAHVGGDRIKFQLEQGHHTITLTSGQLVVDNTAASDTGALVIEGDLDHDGRPDITIDAHQHSRVFLVRGDGDNQAATLDGLVITGGQLQEDENGGGIL